MSPPPFDRARTAAFVALVKALARAFPSPAGVGALGPVRDEAVRFVHDVRPVFHPSDVVAVEILAKNGRPLVRVTTAFLGLVGATSPLASYFTEDVLRAEADENPALRAFYDLFHHRLVSLLVRIHARKAPASELRLDGGDAVTRRSAAAAGIPAGEALSRRAWLGAARVLGRRRRSRDALAAALAHAFPDLAFQIDDRITEPQATRGSGREPRLGGLNARLGAKLRLGGGTPARSGLVRLSLGPTPRWLYAALLPGGELHARLRDVVWRVLGPAPVELEIELGADGAPRARLGGAVTPRLGINALLLGAVGGGRVRVRMALTACEARSEPVYLVSRI